MHCAAMTKLMQWLTFLFAFLAMWISILFDCLPVQLDSSSKEVVWMVGANIKSLFETFDVIDFTDSIAFILS